MTHIVEVRRQGDDLARAMSDLRDWLARYLLQAAAIDYSVNEDGLLLRIQFAVENDASAFAGSFDAWPDHRAKLILEHEAAAAAAPHASGLEERIRHPLLKELFRYWSQLRASDGMARKSRFDPADLSTALWPRLHIVDIPRGDAVCRCRLLGTYLVDAIGRDFTGQPLADAAVPGISGSITYELLQKLRSNGEPQHYYGPPKLPLATQIAMHEQVLLPLHDEGGGVIAAVGAVNYEGFRPSMFGHGATAISR